MQRYRFSRELTVFFDLQSRHFFGLPVEDISLSALTSLVTTVPLYMQNGFKPFIDQIKNSLLQNGVEVRFAEPAPELSYKRKRVVGLMTTRGMVEAKVFLFNIEQQPHASALFLGIHDEVVPAGMAQEVICLPNYARPHDFFVLSLSPRENESHAPRGMRSLTAMFTVPDNSLEQGPLIERIGRIIPFLKEYTVFSDAYSRAPRHYIFPDDMKFKRLNRSSLLSKASAGKLYVIPDDPWMPLQAVSAALQLADKLS